MCESKKTGKLNANVATMQAAGIIVDLYMAALAASGNIHPVCPCLAVQDVDCRLYLHGMWGIFLQISGIELPQGILDSWLTCHRHRPPFRLFHTYQMGFLSP